MTLLSLLSAAAVSLPRDEKAIAARIERVENGLLPPNVIKGRPLPRMRLADRMKHWNGVPGVSLAVINDYKIEWARGYGVLGEGSREAVTPETLFQAGSVSKPVTAMAVLRLVQQGKLSLDEDVNKKLVSWKVPENEFTRKEKVTVRRLLSHTAGLNPTSSGDYPVGSEVPTLLQVLEGRKPANTEPVRAVSVPGGGTSYSGSNYFVLQQLLIDVTGKPFPRLMEELVFRPLGMNDSTFEQPLPKSLQERAAAGKQGATPVEGKWHVKPEMAAAGLWTTPSDLARFAIEIQKSGRGRSNKVLSREMTNLMLSAPPASATAEDGGPGGGMGLGMEFKSEGGLLRFSHGGYTTGYRCQMTAYEDGRGVVVMTNGSSQALLREVIWGVAREYDWPSGSRPKERVLVDLAPAILEEYAGQYENPPNRRPAVSSVTVKDNQLYLDGMRLQPESESGFFGETEATYVFVRDDKGRVSEMIYDYGFAKFTARKIK
ncbi:MAG TPA: serine hydrolase [Pyrinomonadaceae bacterium]|nr:serine hydrolase [Pyrinomonadaceae bacterium]